VDFLLVSFLEKNDCVDYGSLHELFREVYVVDREDDPLDDPDLPHQVRQHCSRSMSAVIARVCREQRPDLLQVEYTHMAGFRQAAPSVPAILVEHDLTFTLYGQLADRTGNSATGQEYRRWLNFERKSFEDYDAVWMMSEEDRATALREGALAERTSVVPNGVDVSRLRPGGSPAAAPEILYVGSFRHLPNLIGFDTLLEEVMPRVWNQQPAAKLVVVSGPDPEIYLREFHKGRPRPPLDPRVWLHAFVPDLRPLYEKAWVVVAPLVVSAGTNVKTTIPLRDQCLSRCATLRIPLEGASLDELRREVDLDALVAERDCVAVLKYHVAFCRHTPVVGWGLGGLFGQVPVARRQVRPHVILFHEVGGAAEVVGVAVRHD
jgi:glycosyltransferase involved in cell wall biosynthesis